MYLSYFGLSEPPFSIAPDPRYLYMSKRHQEALAHLLYGLRTDGGFVVLTGEVGAGKTTVCRCLLEQIPGDCDLAYIFNPKLSVEELLAELCSEFRIDVPTRPLSVKQLVDAINAFLLDGHAKGRHAVLIIDEAQNLSADVLEQMRLLTNLETHERKLLQIVLIGQPELATMLARPYLRQLSQRVVARYHLDPLSEDELAAYIQHRLEVANAQRSLFPKSLIPALYRYSGGVPRILNLICDRALLGTYSEGKQIVDGAILARAAREVFPARRQKKRDFPIALWLVGAVIGVALVIAAVLMSIRKAGHVETAAPKQAPAPAAVIPAPLAVSLPTVTAAPTTGVVGVLAWPDNVSPALKSNSGFLELYQILRLPIPAAGVCASNGELRCRTTRGSLDEIRSLNRPVLLYLTDVDGSAMDGVLIRLDSNYADVIIGGRSNRVAVTTLAAQWSGQYAFLWRAPNPPFDQIRPGDKGPHVIWLADKLSKVLGQHIEAGPDAIFDDQLRQWVKQFQLQHGLTPDGQVGFQTLVRLSVASDFSAPTLSYVTR